MSSPHSHIRPNTSIFLRLPSDFLKLVEIKPNTIIDIGKFGSFHSNLLLGRPYYLTFEVLEKKDGEAFSRLRVVSAAELNAEIVVEDATPSESRDGEATPVTNGLPEGYDLLGEGGASVVTKNNRLTIDDATRQALSQQDIESLKKFSTGQDIISQILANHSGFSEKTDYSKAKYTLRKTKKYLKRFTVLPMDVRTLMQYILDKEPPRIMELREEMLGLILAWSNVHYTPEEEVPRDDKGKRVGGGRWIVVDDTGGMIVAAMAEKVGILYEQVEEESKAPAAAVDMPRDDIDGGVSLPPEDTAMTDPSDPTTTVKVHRDFPIPAQSNTITLLHPAVQPNLSLLKHFGYDTNQPNASHPLHTHLKPLSWLQLLHPEEDPTYREPEQIPSAELQTWKSGKRGAYWKRRRRWERCKAIVDEAREGGFEGLVVASAMDPESICAHAVPLIRGGGHVVIYSPTIEPLVKLMDLYSRERRTAYITHLANGETPDSGDFPVDPRLLLAPTLQTSKARQWQVLPGRTHPLMTGRGGAEGYVFTARRAIPLEGGVEAKGNFSGKKRKVTAVEKEGGVG